MLFIASKVVGFITVPSNAIALLGLAGLLLLLLNQKRSAVSTLASAFILLVILGFSPAANVMLLVLSERFPAWRDDGRAPDGIIVLGGGLDPDLTTARRSPETTDAGERVLAMLDLARRYPQARIVYTSGSGNLLRGGPAEAPLAGRVLDDFGLANGRVVLEDQSRTTAENAALTRALVTPRPGERWLLVTSAYHMPRSIAAFRGAGFEVEAYPVDFRTTGWGDAAQPFDKISSGLGRSDVAMHEWVGLIALRLTGRSDELFPSPRPPATSILPRQP